MSKSKIHVVLVDVVKHDFTEHKLDLCLLFKTV